MAEPVKPWAAQPLVVPEPSREPPRYALHFRAAYVALAVVLAAAVAVLATALVEGTIAAPPPWAAWHPSGGSRVDEASQIAKYVAPEYRRDTGAQLVAVQVHGPEVQNVPLAAVAVRATAGSNQNVDVQSAQNSIVYVLCGLGSNCTIPGTASKVRARLMRREALEMALYTFKYVQGVDSVVALLPPPKDSSINWSLYFRRSDFASQLSRPLAATLPAAKRLTPSSYARENGSIVEQLTRPRWFQSQFQQLQDGSAILVLDPLKTSG